MGSDDLFKKRRKERKERKCEMLTPKANSFLIVTEGECTEPMYFEGIEREIRGKVGGRIDVENLPRIDIHGEGTATSHLLQATRLFVKKANIVYQNIWIVLDKDDFEDFDETLKAAEKEGYNVAWNNQCFEYWLFLHFRYSDAALHRNDWIRKLDEIFRRLGISDGKYHKNAADIYDIVNTYGSIDNAIKNAKARMKHYDRLCCKPSAYDPGITVYELVEQLKKYLE